MATGVDSNKPAPRVNPAAPGKIGVTKIKIRVKI